MITHQLRSCVAVFKSNSYPDPLLFCIFIRPAVARVFDASIAQITTIENRLAHAKAPEPSGNIRSDVDAAVGLLDRLTKQEHNIANLAGAKEAIVAMNARLFLGFEKTQQKNRTVNKIKRGVVTFGDGEPPIQIYDGPTGRKHFKSSKAVTLAAGPGGEESPADQCFSSQESTSGNTNRGDRIRTCDLLAPSQTR